MKVALLDVNALLAMVWPNHIHHGLVRNWFNENHKQGWATCPLTQVAFVRLSSNPAFTKEAVSPPEAMRMLQKICQRPHHHFWPASLSAYCDELDRLHLLGHRQVTDAYLLGLAIHHHGRLVSLDQGIRHLLPHNSAWASHLCLLQE